MKILLRLVFEVNCHVKGLYKINEQDKEKHTEIKVFCGTKLRNLGRIPLVFYASSLRKPPRKENRQELRQDN